ncbi:hypothetical protein H5410_036244, partial [Solanum commersonii]
MTCYNYGLLNTVYTYDEEELRKFILCKILYGNSRDIICGNRTSDTSGKDRTNERYDNTGRYRTATRDTKKPDTIFFANKRIIGISTIIQELANNYLNENAIWSYYGRDQYCKLIGHKYPDHICSK